MLDVETKRARQREATRRYRERLRAAGLPTSPPNTEERKAQIRDYMRAKRAEATQRADPLPSDEWWKRNPEKHRERTRRWRTENLEYARAITRDNQADRRSTPWGQINNRIWTVIHWGVRANATRLGKYNRALGYTWATLRAHLEAQFQPGMNWDNWGEAWELDHVRPASEFRYVSLDDPLFREAWQLSNLRPLWRADNQAKGRRQT